MKKTLKLIMSVLMVAALLVTMCIPAMADSTNVALKSTEPSAADEATVTIHGIQPVDPSAATKTYPTVKLYQIVAPQYDTDGLGLVGFNAVTGVSIADLAAPTAAEIEAIYAALAGGTLSLTATTMDTTTTAGDAVATVGAGMYIAVVTNAGSSIYNPIIASINYVTEDGKTVVKPADIAEGATLKISDSETLAKIQTPVPDKDVSGQSEDSDETSASVGDILNYSITVPVPQYPENATNKTLYAYDTMQAGLELVPGSVKVDGAATVEYATVATTTTTLGVDFDVTKMTAASSTITYQVRVTEAAVVGPTGNKNTVNLYFANKPYTGSTYEPGDTPTPPTPSEDNGIGTEKDEVVVYTYAVGFHKVGDANDTDKAGLANAIFGVYSDASCETLVDYVTTNASGYGISNQVKAGTYYLKEVNPPVGYSLNTTVYTVEASKTSATYTVTTATTSYSTTPPYAGAPTVGWLLNSKFYTKKPSDDAAAAYAVSTNNNTTVTEDTDFAGTSMYEVEGEVGDIQNTEVKEMPSTGGIGTYVFTFGGLILMGLAIALIASKKRAAKAE